MMKMYKKPETEIVSLEAEKLLQGLITMSPGDTNGGGGGTTDAPARRGDIID